ncbi:MAG: S8 family serine peptidase, partial [Planctomycetes bacterium]|nr:S8 family serine peptidase [Planctomycetota bacterium]
MNFKRTTRTSQRLGHCLVTAGTIAFGALQALADDPHWVAADGGKVSIKRSTDELGVILKGFEFAPGYADRVEARGLGRLEDFPEAPFARVKLMRINASMASRRDVIQQDSAVKEIHPVYRLGPRDAIAIGSGSLLVKVRPEIPAQEIAQLWSEFNVGSADPLEGMNGVYRAVPKVEDGEVELSEAMAGDARVVWAQPNFHRPMKRSQLTINDPYYNRQWHLNNTGQAGTAGADIDAPEAWAVSDGQDILIGMFDDAVDVDHEDLRDGYIGTGHDPSLPSNDPGFKDPRPKILGDSHGTSVAGLAFARANSVGGRGVAFASRFTASRGLGEMLTDAEIASVFTFARQQKVDVHINSWGLAGYPPNPQVIVDAIELAFDQGRQLGDLNGDGTPDPPRGMVIIFAAGNDGIAIESGFDLSTIPQVISVGATGPNDVVPLYSNFGVDLDVVAPGGGDAPPGLFTTDVTDKVGNPENGMNVGGTNPETGQSEPDAAGKYIDSFAGTSAACPVVGGVAALVLSVNPALTATDVRLVLGHTADHVSPNDASYNPITSRSNVYGYGRVNAGGAGAKVGAVEAAKDTLSNGGLTWPDRVSSVSVVNSTLNWHQGANTDEFLVLQSDSAFQFVPTDGICYDSHQLGCGSQTIQPLPTGVTVLAVGCSLVCSSSQTPKCEASAAQCVSFLQPGGTKSFAIYGRSRIGRYSFGVAADSNGEVTDPGTDTGGGSSGGSGGGGTTVTPPAVTITATPLQGQSPLYVTFNGNAV